MRIIAAIDDSDAAVAVLGTAKALTRLTGCALQAVHVIDPLGPRTAERATRAASSQGLDLELVEGEPVDAIVARLSPDDVLLGVVGARGGELGKRPAGHTALAVVTGSDKPVVVAPPEARMGALRRLLIPLEGTRESSEAVAATVSLLADCGAEVIPLHVFTPSDIPRFWDQPQHAAAAWSDEFLARFGPSASTALRIRGGDVSDATLDVGAEEKVDLIAVGWSQNLSRGRARTVRKLLSTAQVPILLVPMPSSRARDSGAERG